MCACACRIVDHREHGQGWPAQRLIGHGRSLLSGNVLGGFHGTCGHAQKDKKPEHSPHQRHAPFAHPAVPIESTGALRAPTD